MTTEFARALEETARVLARFSETDSPGARRWNGAGYVTGLREEVETFDPTAAKWWGALIALAGVLGTQDVLSEGQKEFLNRFLFGGMGSLNDLFLDENRLGPHANQANHELNRRRAELFAVFQGMSRPLAGHADKAVNVRIDDAGDPVSAAQLSDLEYAFGAPLPQDYVQFLMTCNGGVPHPNTIDVEGLPGSPTDVQELFGVGLDKETSNASWYLREIPDRIPRGLFPFARDSGGNLFCLSSLNDGTGKVVYLDMVEEVGVQYLVAADFKGFMAKIR